MNVILVNSIPASNFYFFDVNHENGHNYTVIINVNENKEFVSTEIYDKCHEDAVIIKEDNEIFYDEMLNYIKNNWTELVLDNIYPTLTGSDLI